MKINDLRPKIHFTAQKNWINDPNGFSFYKGFYHLFFQYNPKGIVWGNMSWGHAISKDLIHWKELEVAMVPDKSYDKGGVFSGSAMDVEGVHTIYYTGVEYVPQGLKQVQCKSTSRDGISYEKDAENPVLIADEYADEYDFRDPKVWLYDKHTYMIVGTKKEGNGKAVIYKSANGNDFDYVTEFKKENTGYMWECPDLFQLKEQWVLIFSSIEVEGYPAENIAFIAPVDFDYKMDKTQVHRHELMDYGADFYAPQSMIDEKGRRIVIGWLRMEKPLKEDVNWVGMMTLPREVQYYGDGFHYQVVEEALENKRSITKEEAYLVLEEGQKSVLNSEKMTFKLKRNRVYELNADLSLNSRIRLCDGQDGGFSVMYDDTSNQVKVVRGYNKETFYSPAIQSDKVELQIIIDQSVAEIFIEDGRYVISLVFSHSGIQNNLIVERLECLDDFELYEVNV